MKLNNGYAYREQLNNCAKGRSILEYLTARYSHSTRAEWQARLERGEVQLGEQTATAHQRLSAGQVLVWHRPPWLEKDAPLHFEVLYQDEHLIAVSKPSGLPTMPAGGFLQHTLLHLLRAEFGSVSPMHRLGRATSGIVLFARSSAAAAPLAEAWRNHQVSKQYLALAQGRAEQDEYRITAAIGSVPHPLLGEVYAACPPESPKGKPSLSVARVLERRSLPNSTDATLFEVDIQTGRPHQIRIHLASIGHPLVGDPLYASGGLPLAHLPGLPGDGGYWLHAQRLSLAHPISGERLSLEATPPSILRVGLNHVGDEHST